MGKRLGPASAARSSTRSYSVARLKPPLHRSPPLQFTLLTRAWHWRLGGDARLRAPVELHRRSMVVFVDGQSPSDTISRASILAKFHDAVPSYLWWDDAGRASTASSAVETGRPASVASRGRAMPIPQRCWPWLDCSEPQKVGTTTAAPRPFALRQRRRGAVRAEADEGLHEANGIRIIFCFALRLRNPTPQDAAGRQLRTRDASPITASNNPKVFSFNATTPAWHQHYNYRDHDHYHYGQYQY